MSIHRDILKVMTFLAVIGLAAASGYPAHAQSTQQQNGSAYDQPSPTVGSGQTTTTNPQTNPQSKPSSGDSN